MSKPASPSMPTRRQIAEAVEAVRELFPNARIAKVGPDGVEFAYPDVGESHDPVEGWLRKHGQGPLEGH